MGHQVPMGSELPVMNWVLSDPPHHKVGHAQQHPSSNGSGIYRIDHVKAVLKSGHCIPSRSKCQSQYLIIEKTIYTSVMYPLKNNYFSVTRCRNACKIISFLEVTNNISIKCMSFLYACPQSSIFYKNA